MRRARAFFWQRLVLPALAAPPIVIQNANVLTVTKGTFHGSVLIRDGKIAEMGEKVMIPDGAQIIDAGGQYVMPGIIDSHSHIAAEAINEGSISVSLDGRHRGRAEPGRHRHLPRARRRRDHRRHPARQRQSHRRAVPVIKMRWGKDAEGILFEGASRFSSSRSARTRSAAAAPSALGVQTPARYPATRMGVEDVIREAFTEARTYQTTRGREYDAKVQGGEHALPPRDAT